MKRKSLLFAMMLCFAFFGVAKAQLTQNLLTEDFSSMSSIATTYSATDWYAYNAGSGNNWTLSSGAARYNYSSYYDANCYLVSAPFSVSSDMMELSVSLAEKTGSYSETFEVFFVKASDVTSDAAVVSATHYNAIASATYTNTTAATVSGSVTAAALAGQSVRVVVHCTSEADQYYLTVDDIIVTETLAPQGPYIMLDPTSATIITGSTQTLTATYGNATNPTFSYTSSNTSVASVTSTGGTTATVTGESAGTATITATMTVNGTDYTATCAITVEVPSYCTPGTGNYDNDGISNVTFGTNGVVVNNTVSGIDYGDYSNLVGAVEAGTTSFEVAITYKTSYTYGTIIWVDWDNSYSFEGTEVVYAGQSGSSNPTTLTATFDIPSTALGDYRMRIIGADQALDNYTGSISAAASVDACGSFNWSTCHDYTLRVEAGNPCTAPTNLQASQVGTTTAHLSWDGSNDSYVLRYRTAAHDNMNLWEQVGSDKAATATLTQYTYDLSDYSGTGNIAIRHYNVSDMFRLAIDDVVVTDARGQELVNEDFESGSIPSSWTNYDLDGDGNVWIAVSFDSQVGNGDYVAVSDSWNQSVGALTPDNWLIIPNVALGGTLTFYARGVDANYPQENFGVFVTNESLETVFANVPAGNWSADIPVSTTSYELTGLTANTPYEWQVKGICGDEESGWAASSFSTIAEGFKTFITAGAWNVADNWFPVGVPTIEDEVSIEAAVTVPAGVVASAKRAVLNGGSILVKDGGQLKQGAATLNITMEKEITGYVDAETNPGNYYFIASPFGGRTQLAYNASWSHVLNVTSGEYDLYAFDPTQDLEWINYESQDSNNPHELFYEMSLQSGTGYLYANEADKTLTFTGTAWSSLNSSTTVDYTYNAESTDDFNGWKLVGNPYTCNGYISYVDAQGNALEADFYTLNLDNTYSLMSSNQPLPPCTGALMNVSATGKVQYSTEAPAKRASFLNMNVSRGNKTVSQARLRFGQGHNLGSMSFRNGSRLYMNVDGNDYAVVYTEKQGEMPVSFKAESNGTYSLSFTSEEVTFSYLHLIDNMTGNDVNLLQTPSYTFDARTTDYESRFRLVFATGSSTGSDTFGFVNASGNFCIFGIEGEATVQVIDVLGHVLSSETFSGSYEKRINGAPGVYMVRLIQGNDVKVQKVVVR